MAKTKMGAPSVPAVVKLSERRGERAPDGPVSPVPESEVAPTPPGVASTAESELWILREAESQRELGGFGVLLRHEGLYSTQLTTWRRQRDCGALDALLPLCRRRAGPRSGFLDVTSSVGRDWRATFYRAGRVHSATWDSGSAFEPSPFMAVQKAALTRGDPAETPPVEEESPE